MGAGALRADAVLPARRGPVAGDESPAHGIGDELSEAEVGGPDALDRTRGSAYSALSEPKEAGLRPFRTTPRAITVTAALAFLTSAAALFVGLASAMLVTGI